jgi:hypothetical protein
MTETNERGEYRTTQLFGLLLMAIFAGLLILNGISF